MPRFKSKCRVLPGFARFPAPGFVPHKLVYEMEPLHQTGPGA